MKTTRMFHSTANPRRTTVTGLTDADEPQAGSARPDAGHHGSEQPEADGRRSEPTPPETGPGAEPPDRTANPRRTTVPDGPAR